MADLGSLSSLDVSFPWAERVSSLAVADVLEPSGETWAPLASFFQYFLVPSYASLDVSERVRREGCGSRRVFSFRRYRYGTVGCSVWWYGTGLRNGILSSYSVRGRLVSGVWCLVSAYPFRSEAVRKRGEMG